MKLKTSTKQLKNASDLVKSVNAAAAKKTAFDPSQTALRRKNVSEYTEKLALFSNDIRLDKEQMKAFEQTVKSFVKNYDIQGKEKDLSLLKNRRGIPDVAVDTKYTDKLNKDERSKLRYVMYWTNKMIGTTNEKARAAKTLQQSIMNETFKIDGRNVSRLYYAEPDTAVNRLVRQPLDIEVATGLIQPYQLMSRITNAFSIAKKAEPSTYKLPVAKQRAAIIKVALGDADYNLKSFSGSLPSLKLANLYRAASKNNMEDVLKLFNILTPHELLTFWASDDDLNIVFNYDDTNKTAVAGNERDLIDKLWSSVIAGKLNKKFPDASDDTQMVAWLKKYDIYDILKDYIDLED